MDLIKVYTKKNNEKRVKVQQFYGNVINNLTINDFFKI